MAFLIQLHKRSQLLLILRSNKGLDLGFELMGCVITGSSSHSVDTGFFQGLFNGGIQIDNFPGTAK